MISNLNRNMNISARNIVEIMLDNGIVFARKKSTTDEIFKLLQIPENINE